MGTNVKGTIGLPSLKIFSFESDRTGRTKTTHLFGGAKRKNSPAPKTLPQAPKVKAGTLLTTARAKAPVGPPVRNGGTVTVPQPQPQQEQPRLDGNRPPRPVGPPPLNPPAQKLVSEMPARIDEVAKKVSAFTSDVAKSGSSEKLVETRQALLKDVQGKLAELEKAAPYNLAMPSVDALRTRLVGLAIDLAFPELAETRQDKEQLGEEARRFLSGQKGVDDPGAKVRTAHAKLARELTDMRTGFAGKPAVAEIVTSQFLKSMANTPILRGSQYSPEDKLIMLRQLTFGLSHGEVAVGPTPLIDTSEPGVKSLLSELRANHYSTAAARNFVMTLDPLAEPELLKDFRELDTDGIRKLSNSDIRKMIPDRLHGDFDKAVDGGRKAAKLRDEYEAQLSRTARALGSGNARLAEFSVLLRAKGALVVTGSDLRVRASEDQIDKTLKNLARTNKEGAFQVAKLAMVMERLAAAEEGTLGYNQFGMNTDERFDAKAILQITGVSEKDIEAMGYSLDEVGGSFEKNMERLGTSGFEGVDHVKQTMDRMRGAKAVLENRDVQDNLHADLQHQFTALGKLLNQDIATDALETVGSQLGDDLSKDPKVALSQAFAGISSSVDDALFRTETGEDSELGTRLGELQGDILVQNELLVTIAGDITTIENEIATHQQVLIDYKGDHGKIDTKKPAGLQSAKLILKALELDERAKQLPAGGRRNLVLLQRDLLLEDLKGFDSEVLKRTWTGKSPFSRSAPPTIDQVRDLKAQAEAIVFLRETGPERLAEARARQSDAMLARDGLIDERHSASPRLFNAMNRIIHAAVIAKIPFDQPPKDVESGFNPDFDMAGKRDEIVAQLREWGVDSEHFAAEIDEAISKPVTRETLQGWRKTDSRGSFDDLLETGFIDRTPRKQGSRFGRIAMDGLMLIANKRRVNTQMRNELSALVDALPNNSKFDLMSGTQISLNTGRIPVEPTGIVTVRGRLAGSIFKSMVIETGSSGEIKLTGMLGGTVKAGIDLQAAIKLAEAEVGSGKAEVKFGAELSGDIGYEGAGGYQITFPKGEAGREAAIAFLLHMTENQRPSGEMFETVSEVSTFRRHKGNAGFKSELSAKASLEWQPGGNDGDMFDDGMDDPNLKSGAKNKHGFGISAGIAGRGGIGGKKEVFHSLDKTTVKTEFQTKISIGAKASIFAQTFTGLGMVGNVAMDKTGAQDGMDNRFDKDSGSKVEGTWDGGSGTTPLELAGISVETSVTSIHKKKFEFDVVGNDGREVMAKAELKELTDGINTPTMHHMLGSFSDEMIDKLRQSPEKLKQVRSMLDEISRIGLSSSLVEVTYNIKPEKLSVANELFREAEIAKTSGDSRRARELQGQAQDIVDNRDNYTPAKISLIDKTSTTGVANRGNAMLARVDITSTVGTERVILSVGL